ncbi:MAG TPA: preprotein translocase subunit SecG [Amaricoccus sp.]|uniref:preprotein translocase subunit SecG n=1 Tax=Amaricoccus sp. TaxID=1872485 RepID=UPI002D149D62|nr:preprotein translocase subunit SecG [Amaricoccus sp.]HMQ93676.1 preprotein translocase subunit SecG [Amaricoccus sp.]HMR52309.1 preprotein translocase subunit SecG [Amaricoccus sp.]HMR61029.1 preprotein translocase subunit SecG [Amaricoccus sp.]HMT99230.1 preprotein translocase subunit SecG [Amaricoccus sp.]
MANVVLTIHLLLALSLIVVVLLQRSEGGGLGIGGGGGGVMTGRGAATALSKLTWALGVAFVATSLALTIIAARDSARDSVIDRAPAGAEAPAEDLTAPPALGEDLLPPGPAEGPAAPPAAE